MSTKANIRITVNAAGVEAHVTPAVLAGNDIFCDRCSGQGYFPTHLNIDGGRCFKCKGDGYLRRPNTTGLIERGKAMSTSDMIKAAICRLLPTDPDDRTVHWEADVEHKGFHFFYKRIVEGEIVEVTLYAKHHATGRWISLKWDHDIAIFRAVEKVGKSWRAGSFN